MADQQVPSVGRVVHYVLSNGPRKGEHRAAIITRLETLQGLDAVSLNVQLAPGDLPIPDTLSLPEHWSQKEQERVYYTPILCIECVLFSAAMIEDTWHWPEFVPPLGVTGKEAW